MDTASIGIIFNDHKPPSHFFAAEPAITGLLSLAIPPWVGALSASESCGL